MLKYFEKITCMEALNDNRADEGGRAGNLAAMCASLLPPASHQRLSSSYQYKNSALSIRFKIKAEQMKPQNSSKNKTNSLTQFTCSKYYNSNNKNRTFLNKNIGK